MSFLEILLQFEPKTSRSTSLAWTASRWHADRRITVSNHVWCASSNLEGVGTTLSSTAIDIPRAQAPSSILRWYVLILTCLIYAINIADRYVVSTVLEPIRLELRLDDAGVAFLTGAPLALFYVTFGIPISWLADRSNRRNILAVSLIIWSAFTALCGLSRNYWEFLFGRIGVGVGEAGGTPPSTAIVSDYFPADRRPMAMTVLALGAPIGAWLGANMAGAVAHAYTWRAAFLALGIPGLLVGVIVYLTVREPARGRLDAIVDEIKPSLWESLRVSLAPKGGLPRRHGRRPVCAVGMGPDLLDADVSAAGLQS